MSSYYNEDTAIYQRAKHASIIEAGLTNDLLNRMPPEQVTDCLGKPLIRIPGTERVYKTSQVQRWAA